MELAPLRAEHQAGIAAVLQEPGHINYPNAQGRVEALACEMRTLNLFLSVANADIPAPPPGHVKAAAFGEKPVPLTTLMLAGHKARRPTTDPTDRKATEAAFQVVSEMRIPGLPR